MIILNIILINANMFTIFTSGEYSCQPAVGPVAAVLVHVLNRDTEVQAVLGEGQSPGKKEKQHFLEILQAVRMGQR